MIKTLLSTLMKAALLSVVLLVLGGCDSAIDCLDSDGPQFDTREIRDPVLNQEYSQTIRASINNEPQDDRFSYRFVPRGQLPAGLGTASTGRDFSITGTATELGAFSFSLFVEVMDPVGADESGLCFTSTSKTYSFIVQQEN